MIVLVIVLEIAIHESKKTMKTRMKVLDSHIYECFSEFKSTKLTYKPYVVIIFTLATRPQYVFLWSLLIVKHTKL